MLLYRFRMHISAIRALRYGVDLRCNCPAVLPELSHGRSTVADNYCWGSLSMAWCAASDVYLATSSRPSVAEYQLIPTSILFLSSHHCFPEDFRGRVLCSLAIITKA
ncbi:hypothetical protein M758_8G093200 [Ceratodon purpureus]|nr:hypothetical protein M758_8G093200 [Ceratodon purpureus]